ncbi:JAB domain-containing protein [Liquorilactobacillus sp.]|uniref:JAB domain-containing protein n=1 Tax=Liquorilactobacillus sp. TaxID=2767923 RepID=UPI0039EC8BFE
MSTVHIGTIPRSIAVPRNVIRTAILSNASRVIVAYNYPSGETTTSKEDINFTRGLYQACKLLQIKLLDHLVIGLGGEYLSMRAENMFGAVDSE